MRANLPIDWSIGLHDAYLALLAEDRMTPQQMADALGVSRPALIRHGLLSGHPVPRRSPGPPKGVKMPKRSAEHQAKIVAALRAGGVYDKMRVARRGKSLPPEWCQAVREGRRRGKALRTAALAASARPVVTAIPPKGALPSYRGIAAREGLTAFAGRASLPIPITPPAHPARAQQGDH